MEQRRGLLLITDPTKPPHRPTIHPNTNAMTLVFNENERYLVQAQQALWKLRLHCGWICVQAEGDAACIALSLAAQLPVDRLYLRDPRLFASPPPAERQIARLRSFARRNLSLVISQLLLADVREGEMRRLLRFYPGREICLTDESVDPTLPWPALTEKNLLIPGKCV